MRKVVKLGGAMLGFLLACIVAALLVVLRYILRTPQSLESILPGEARLYKWQYGHIYYKVTGAPDAPALVLCHAPGIGASGYEMRYLVQELAHDYQVYTLDLLGFGLSDRPHVDYTADLYVALCRDFLREVVQRPAVLLGSGRSCNYCVAVADSAPALCQRLILITPETIFATPQRPSWLTMLASNQLVGFVLYAFVTSRSLLRIIVNRSHGLDKKSCAGRVEADELHYRFAAAHQFHAQHVVLALLSGKLDLEVVHRLPYLAQPVQMIWGERVASALPRLPAVTVQMCVDTIDGSNVFPHEEQPEKVIACIRAQAAKLQDLLQPASVVTVSEPQAEVTGKTAAGLEHVEESSKQETTGGEAEETSISATDATARAEPPAGEDVVTQEGVMAYCFKCKQKRAIQHAQRITTPRGRQAVEGTCPVCGTRLFRFVAGQAD
jgi:pimeloyl-ACP methyl ester carboxylesterase